LPCLASHRQHVPPLPEASLASHALSRGKTCLSRERAKARQGKLGSHERGVQGKSCLSTREARQGKSCPVLHLSCETCLRSLEALSCLASRRQHLPPLPEPSFASRALSGGKTLSFPGFFPGLLSRASFPGFFPGKERRKDKAFRTLAREVRLALYWLPEATLAFALPGAFLLYERWVYMHIYMYMYAIIHMYSCLYVFVHYTYVFICRYTHRYIFIYIYT